MVEGYCVKCKEKRNMNELTLVKTKRGTPMAKGKCETCKCGMCKMLSKDQAAQIATDNNIQLPE